MQGKAWVITSRSRHRLTALVTQLWLVLSLGAAETVDHPFPGVTHIVRVETSPRALHIHVVKIDLTTPGLRFKLTSPGGSRETVRQTTLDFLRAEHAEIAINAHYFLPWPSFDAEAFLVGFAASEGRVFSAFETPEQSYALARDAPALNIDPENHASIVHRNRKFADGLHVREHVRIWTAVAGSAQIVTHGKARIPRYGRELTPGGPRNYSRDNSWYDVLNARSAIGLSKDRRTLFLFTVDKAGGSLGMKVAEVATLLIRDYRVFDALNLDGGGSTTLAMDGAMVNVSSDNPDGRRVGSNLAVFVGR